MIKKPELILPREIYKGWVKLDVHTYKVEGTIKTQNYDIVTVGDGVAILPFLDEKTVLLARQYRPPVEDYLLELIQGGMKKDESPIDAAKRELLEETGYEGKIEYIATIYPLPTALNMRLHLLKATELIKVSDPEENPLEVFELVKMPYDQLLKEVLSGVHKDSALRDIVMHHNQK
jgi:ADP-ribose pyrophosphatase